MSSSVCLVVTSNSCSIAVRDLIVSFLRAGDKDKDLERSDAIVCLEDSFVDLRVENLHYMLGDDKALEDPVFGDGTALGEGTALGDDPALEASALGDGSALETSALGDGSVLEASGLGDGLEDSALKASALGDGLEDSVLEDSALGDSAQGDSAREDLALGGEYSAERGGDDIALRLPPLLSRRSLLNDLFIYYILREAIKTFMARVRTGEHQHPPQCTL